MTRKAWIRLAFQPIAWVREAHKPSIWMDFPYQAFVKKKIIITNYKNFSPGSAKHHQIPVGIGLIGTGLRTVKKLIYWVNVLRLYVYQQSIHKLFLCLKYFQTDSVICLFNFCNKLPCLHGCIIKRLSLVHSRAANCLPTRKNEFLHAAGHDISLILAQERNLYHPNMAGWLGYDSLCNALSS